MSASHIGQKLIEHGWGQGCLLPAVGHTYYELKSNGDWVPRSLSPDPSEQLIVVSQDCDILSSREPFVEAMPCRWHARDTNEYNAGHRANSGRFFLLRRERDPRGQDGAVIVDATRRVLISKESLLGIKPVPGYDANDVHFRYRFRSWLGSRYSRPALDSAVVEAVQKPIVKGIADLRPIDEAYVAIELIREVRMFAVSGPPPYEVNLVILVDDPELKSDERIAAFRGAVEVWLKGSGGVSRLASSQVLAINEFYVSEYEASVRLPLDHYTIGNEDIQGARPVRGLDHG